MSGWGKLGEMLAGGDAGGREKAYIDQTTRVHGAQKSGYDRDKAMESAVRERSINLARAGMDDALFQSAMGGDTAAQAQLARRTVTGNTTMNLGQMGDYQQPHFGEASNIRRDALLGEDVDAPLANRAGAYLSGREYQPTQVMGGAYVADGFQLGDDMVPTPSTAATIAAKEAGGQAALIRANAAAGKDSARAGLYDTQSAAGGYNPNTGRKPKAEASPPVEGAKLAPDGKWYVQQDGRYFLVES